MLYFQRNFVSPTLPSLEGGRFFFWARCGNFVASLARVINKEQNQPLKHSLKQGDLNNIITVPSSLLKSVKDTIVKKHQKKYRKVTFSNIRIVKTPFSKA
jgi:hypothetical protein